jgi:hypothetical protein
VSTTTSSRKRRSSRSSSSKDANSSNTNYSLNVIQMRRPPRNRLTPWSETSRKIWIITRSTLRKLVFWRYYNLAKNSLTLHGKTRRNTRFNRSKSGTRRSNLTISLHQEVKTSTLLSKKERSSLWYSIRILTGYVSLIHQKKALI